MRLTLQAEAAVIAALSVTLYGIAEGGWRMFVLLILAPDLFMLGYLAGPRVGALIYNIGHSYLTPLGVAALGWWIDLPLLVLLALIWSTHIGLDRAIGYGLKYARHFKDTHLGRLG